jgi:hypothetical protein
MVFFLVLGLLLAALGIENGLEQHFAEETNLACTGSVTGPEVTPLR